MSANKSKKAQLLGFIKKHMNIIATVLTTFLVTILLIFGVIIWNIKFNRIAKYVVIEGLSNINCQQISYMYRNVSPELSKCMPSLKNDAFRYWLADDPENNVKLLERFGMQIFVENLDKVPREGGLVVIANHGTEMDPPILIHTLAKIRKDVKCIKGSWSGVYDLSDAHPSKMYIVRHAQVSNGSSRISDEGREKINETLQNGGTIIIFPSGDLGYQEFKTGALRIALDNKVPILLVKTESRSRWWDWIFRSIDPELLNVLILFTSVSRCLRNGVFKVKFGSVKSFSELQELTRSGLIEVDGVRKYDPKIMEAFRREIDAI